MPREQVSLARRYLVLTYALLDAVGQEDWAGASGLLDARQSILEDLVMDLVDEEARAVFELAQSAESQVQDRLGSARADLMNEILSAARGRTATGAYTERTVDSGFERAG